MKTSDSICQFIEGLKVNLTNESFFIFGLRVRFSFSNWWSERRFRLTKNWSNEMYDLKKSDLRSIFCDSWTPILSPFFFFFFFFLHNVLCYSLHKRCIRQKPTTRFLLPFTIITVTINHHNRVLKPIWKTNR